MNIWDILAALRLVSKSTPKPNPNTEPVEPNPVDDPNKTPNPDDPAQAIKPPEDPAEPRRLVAQQIVKAKLQLGTIPAFDRTQELRLFTYFDKVFSPKSTYGVRPSEDELIALRSFFQAEHESNPIQPLTINLERAIKKNKLDIFLNSLFSYEMNFLDQIKAIGRHSGSDKITRETMRDVNDISKEYTEAKKGYKVYLVLNNSIIGTNCIFELSTNLFHALYVVGEGKGLGAFGTGLRANSPEGFADYCRDQYHLWRHSQMTTPRHPHVYDPKEQTKHDLYTGRRISYSLSDLVDFIEFQTSEEAGLSSAFLINEAAAKILLQNEKSKDDSIPNSERLNVHDFRDLMDEYS